MKFTLFVLALATFAVGTDAYVVAGILPPIAQSFSASIPAVGQLVTAYSLTYAVLSPVMATLTAHWPRRSVLFVGLAVFIVGNILTAMAPTFELALGSRAVAGLGGAMITPTAGAVAAALVPPDRRGFALAIVIAGLSAATALGAPIGTVIGNIGDWHLSLWFVAALGILATIGILVFVPIVPPAPALRLKDRLAPLSDARIVTTLATSVLVIFSAFLVYNYVSVVFDRATDSDGTRLAFLLSIWGVAATVGSLAGGRLIDRFGSRLIINLAIVVLVLDFALMPWSGTKFGGAALALTVWGVCGWSFVVAQQHRLISIAPALSPILLGLNASALHLGISVAGAGGGLAMHWLPAHELPLLSATLTVVGGLSAELAYWCIFSFQPQLVACNIAPDDRSQ